MTLYEQVTDWSNLLLAYHKAARGKRGKPSAANFEFQMADRLLQLQEELTGFTYQPGGYVHFLIHEPKLRGISCAYAGRNTARGKLALPNSMLR